MCTCKSVKVKHLDKGVHHILAIDWNKMIIYYYLANVDGGTQQKLIAF